MSLAATAPGAWALPDGSCRFRVWAPRHRTMELRLLSPRERTIAMKPRPRGTFEAAVEDVPPGTLYRYRFADGTERPDPASRLQPEGVHGPSQVVRNDFSWSDDGWRGIALDRYVFYELHVGTFTPEGNFDAVRAHLGRLRELGVTALELMPVAQFPGTRNWGYDGACPYAVQTSYGGPEGLRRLVDACHDHGLAVVLDVVYNHLGPEGNYLGEFGPYSNPRYKTPWGDAINFDDGDSDEVRRYFVENALYWIRDFHIDALRLDALHAVFDRSAVPFLRDLAEAVHALGDALGRRVHLIAESDLNDRRLLLPREREGFGLDASWTDDFHHALHAVLTGEKDGYYCDFSGVDDLARSWRQGYAFTGQYSGFRRRRHGSVSIDLPARQHVVFAQNHDQVGNRGLSDRLSTIVPFEALRVAAAAVVLSPFLPLVFMGEEYGETAPFLYFTSHGDRDLVEAVRKGRREEFAHFDPTRESPDPQAPETLERSRLDHRLRETGRHRMLYAFYRELLRLRREIPALARLDKSTQEIRHHLDPPRLEVVRSDSATGDAVFLVLDLSPEERRVRLELPPGCWARILDSEDARWRIDEGRDAATHQADSAAVRATGSADGRTGAAADGERRAVPAVDDRAAADAERLEGVVEARLAPWSVRLYRRTDRVGSESAVAARGAREA